MEIKEDELLADVRLEGTNPDEENTDEEEKENSPASPAEETNEEEPSTHQEGESDEEEESPDTDEEDDKNIPFHKHPRWKQRQRELEELRQENERLKTETERAAQPQSQVNAEEDMDPDLIRLVGDSPEAVKTYKRLRQRELKQVEEKILQNIESKRAAEQEALKRQERYITSQLDSLRDEGHNFDENKLLKVIDEFRPVDDQGNYDFRRGLELYKLKYPAKKKKDATPKKKVAAKAEGQDTEPTDDGVYKAVVG